MVAIHYRYDIEALRQKALRNVMIRCNVRRRQTRGRRRLAEVWWQDAIRLYITSNRGSECETVLFAG